MPSSFMTTDNENSTKLQCFHMTPDRLSALCNDADWCRKVTSLARALVVLAGAIPTLPKHCKIPESGQETLFQFVFVPLAVSDKVSKIVRLVFSWAGGKRGGKIHYCSGLTIVLFLLGLDFQFSRCHSSPKSISGY